MRIKEEACEVGAEDLKFGVSVFRIYIPSWKHTLDSIA